jgi:hypothetical protein
MEVKPAASAFSGKKTVSKGKGTLLQKMVPTLYSNAPATIKQLILVGLGICIVTVLIADLGLYHEMSTIFPTRPIEALSIMVAVSFLLIAAILLFPILLLHYRNNVLIEEETEQLSSHYNLGMQEFQRRRRDLKPDVDDPAHWSEIAERMSMENADYQDFAYLHITLLQLLELNYDELRELIDRKIQTEEQYKKDKLRELINASAEEIVEDTTYDLPSYAMPVSYTMLAVAFGFIITFFIPLLGTGTVQLGDTTISLVWAAGGFLGAFIYSLFPFFLRYTRRDLPPTAFLHYAMKIFLGTIAVVIVGNLLFENYLFTGVPVAFQFPTAAVLGSMPFLIMSVVRQRVLSKMGVDIKEKGIGSADVCNISGITYEYAERLHEEGVLNIQNLAYADPETLSKRTRFSHGTLFDWKDEAILRLLAENMPMQLKLKTTLTIAPPVPNGKPDDKKLCKECLYDALVAVGIRNLTGLKIWLEHHDQKNAAGEFDSQQTKNLIKLLGWEYDESLECYLQSMCRQGKDMLGTQVKPTITAFASVGRM